MTVSYPAVSSRSVHEHNLYIVVTHIWFQPSWPHMLLLFSSELHATFTFSFNCVRWLL